ncbi:hypothetical protein BDP27DRAFT_1376930 [Rhodocollybia butyracea]|uniref:Uncharacterized protein n=1 Tax=Rhodocollybia butyracea TaxID=206335 RepID=A0A9P5TVP7_9AGAR|nr:hypothetical protein BDP27DRAFT_1376930 [Rhodocollybia butyracea]
MFIIPARLKAIIHSGSPPVVDASQSIPPRYQLFLRNIKPLVKHIGSPGFQAAFGPEWNTLWEWLRAGLSVIRVYEHNAIVSDTLRHSVVALVWPILRVLTHIIEEIRIPKTSNYMTMILDSPTRPLTTDTDLYRQWVTKAVSKMSGTLENDFAEASRGRVTLYHWIKADCLVERLRRSAVYAPWSCFHSWTPAIPPSPCHHSPRKSGPLKIRCRPIHLALHLQALVPLDLNQVKGYRYYLGFADLSCGLTRGNSSEEALLKVWNAAVDTFWNAESVSLRKATWRLTLVTACAKHVIVPVVKWSRTALKHAKLPIIEKHIGWNVKNWELNGKMLIAVYIEHSIYTPGGLGCTIPTLEKHYLREFIKVKITQLGPQIRTLVNNRTDMAVVVDFFTGSADTPSLSTKQEILPKLSSETRKEVGRRTGEILCCARIPLDSKTSALISHVPVSSRMQRRADYLYRPRYSLAFLQLVPHNGLQHHPNHKNPPLYITVVRLIYRNIIKTHTITTIFFVSACTLAESYCEIHIRHSPASAFRLWITSSFVELLDITTHRGYLVMRLYIKRFLTRKDRKVSVGWAKTLGIRD